MIAMKNGTITIRSSLLALWLLQLDMEIMHPKHKWVKYFASFLF